MKYFYQIDRVKRETKKWGVFEHRVTQPNHPLLREINTRFDVPHSRWNSITREQIEDAGLTVLIQSFDGEIHMAVSPDQLRMVYFQGHPEYDINSLLKEYKRDLLGYFHGQNAQPPYPENYFPIDARDIAERFVRQAQSALENGRELPEFPEDEFLPWLDNTWGDTAKAIFNNWLGSVYQVTSVIRHIPFDDSGRSRRSAGHTLSVLRYQLCQARRGRRLPSCEGVRPTASCRSHLPHACFIRRKDR